MLAIYCGTAPAPKAGSFSVSPALDGASESNMIPNLLAYINAPKLDADEIPDSATLTYTLLECADQRLSDVHASTILGVQRGNGGQGAVAALFAGRPRFGGGRYWGLRVDASDGVKVAGMSFDLRWALS